MENNEDVKKQVEDTKENKKHKKENKDNKELIKLQEENAVLKDKLLRLSAEVQNIKKRYEDEISRIYKYEGEDFIKKILIILDNFERAISMDDDNLEDEVSKFLEGFKLIYKNLKNDLEEKNVKEIECLDKLFDPKEMEAVLTACDNTKENGIVLDVLQKGYTYNDKVIRPAMVKVNERNDKNE